MADKGLLIYGLSKSDADHSCNTLSSALSCGIDMISASSHEELIISKLLESEATPVFEEKEIRFVMFLGFDDSDIRTALKNFPQLSVPRPIFCTLTENNLSWKVRDLAEHLVEEDTRMRSSAPQK